VVYRRTALMMVMLVLTASLSAETLSVALNRAAVISGMIRGKQRARVLVPLPIPDDVAGAEIDFALIHFPAFILPDTSVPLRLQALPVATPWDSGTVSWTHPWRNAGGDFDSTRPASYALVAGDNHRVALDVTECLQGIQNGETNCGLVLLRPRAEGGGFGLELANFRNALRQARLKFYYHHVHR
jgi:hypothetical protein